MYGVATTVRGRLVSEHSPGSRWAATPSPGRKLSKASSSAGVPLTTVCSSRHGPAVTNRSAASRQLTPIAWRGASSPQRTSSTSSAVSAWGGWSPGSRASSSVDSSDRGRLRADSSSCASSPGEGSARSHSISSESPPPRATEQAEVDGEGARLDRQRRQHPSVRGEQLGEIDCQATARRSRPLGCQRRSARYPRASERSSEVPTINPVRPASSSWLARAVSSDRGWAGPGV